MLKPIDLLPNDTLVIHKNIKSPFKMGCVQEKTVHVISEEAAFWTVPPMNLSQNILIKGQQKNWKLESQPLWEKHNIQRTAVVEQTRSSCVWHRGLYTSNHLVKHSGPGGRSSRCHICNRVQLITVGCALSRGRSTVPWRLLAARWEDATRHVWGLLRYTYRTLLAHIWITDIMPLFCESRFIGENLSQKRGQMWGFLLISNSFSFSSSLPSTNIVPGQESEKEPSSGATSTHSLSPKAHRNNGAHSGICKCHHGLYLKLCGHTSTWQVHFHHLKVEKRVKKIKHVFLQLDSTSRSSERI